MKTTKHSNIIAVIAGIGSATLLTLVALVSMITSGAPVQMNWLPLSGLVLGGVAVCGLIAGFFNSIDR